ncbi:MAG TPA: NAD(P)H-dependent oxidoreductase [Longimicrobiales bacterium]|nr:NAD(P)H-dependent oxidoreductase [Longimicrobiales bacterium]
MKATILLATLKSEGLSNTETLSQFLQDRMAQRRIDCKIVKLVNHEILPGTCSDMGAGDEWPRILQQVLESDVVIFATPIWWDNHSSLMQRVIERLDELHDKVMAGEPSPLEGKAGGIVITGDSDGAQHVIGHIGNFFNAIGLVLPPYATLSVLWERQAKGEHPTREELLAKYEADYASAADKMIAGLETFARK